MPDMEPITREEALMNGDYIEPITREEMILAGEDIEPITRREWFLKKYRGGGDIEVVTLHANENTTYVAPEGQAYSPVEVDVPVPTLTTLEVDENGTYTAPSGTAYNEVEVDVPLPENAYLLKDIPNTPTAIATFSDGSNLPMPKLEVGIEPVQEGSGDPSPTNVRPISGWDEVDVTRTGKNLFDKTATDTSKGFISGKWINQTGNTFSYGDWSVSEYIRVDGEKIAVSGMTVAEQVSSGRGGYCCYDKYKNVLGGGTYNALTQIITLPTNTKYIRISVWNQNNDVCQLELSETATTYEPYNGTTYTLSLGSTRYGGKVDLVSGVMTVNKLFKKGATVARVGQTDSGVRYVDTTNVYTGLVQNVLTISDRYIQIDTSQSGKDGKFRVYNGEFTIYDNRFTDATTAQSYLNDVEFCYELATPLTIQLTPTVVKSLRGMNNVYADTGNILDLSYLAKEE